MDIDDSVTPAARELAEASGAFSEQFLRGLSEPDLGHTHRLAYVDGQLAGLWASDGATAELFVDPAYRRRGIAAELISRDAVPVWLHNQGEEAKPAEGLAQKLGWRKTRELLVMGIEGTQLRERAEGAVAPEGFRRLNLTESVMRFGEEHALGSWLEVNNQAFSWHPEQGGWTMEDLKRGMEAQWFDPADVLFLWGHSDPPQLAGFHWTKWHGEGLGEVYVVGLAPQFQGRHLSIPLLDLGLARQVARGATRVILYVEADNEAALGLYRRQGFEVAESHVVFSPEKN